MSGCPSHAANRWLNRDKLKCLRVRSASCQAERKDLLPVGRCNTYNRHTRITDHAIPRQIITSYHLLQALTLIEQSIGTMLQVLELNIAPSAFQSARLADRT